MGRPEQFKEGGRRATIRDIAAKAGVHFTTVALALRDNPKLSADTRERVQRIARELGYCPDPMLAALSAYRNRLRKPRFQAVIGWVNNWARREEMLGIRGFRDYYEGAREQAERMGYLLEDLWVREPGMSAARFRSILHARNIHGLLLAPQPKPTNSPPFDVGGFSVVCFGYSILPARFHVVTNHHFHSMRLLIERVEAFGYRRLGYIGAREWDEKVENAWLGGLALARWRKSSVKSVPPLLADPISDRSVKEWIERTRPDVIISFSAMRERLEKMGWSAPRDIGFVSLNVGEAERSVSGLLQNDLEIGRMAIKLLVQMINSGERGQPAVPMSTLVESGWNEGSTLRRQGDPRCG